MLPVKNTANTILLLQIRKTTARNHYVWHLQIIKLQHRLLYWLSIRVPLRVLAMLINNRKTLVPSMILRCCCLRSSKPSPLVSSDSSKSHGLVTPRLTPPVIRLDLKIISANNFQHKTHSLYNLCLQDWLRWKCMYLLHSVWFSAIREEINQKESDNLQ